MMNEVTLGQAWETLVLECRNNGRVIETEYGEESKDLSPGAVLISKPLEEPVIHRAAFAWHKKDSYTKEILEGSELEKGIDEGKEWYTYHQRLFHWPWFNVQVNGVIDGDLNPQATLNLLWRGIDRVGSSVEVNQIDYIVAKLKEAPHSRRVQGVTWNPLIDETSDVSPCLQRIWSRIVNGSLEMHTYWRSRDLWKAWWLNTYAMIQIQKMIAERLNVRVGSHFDLSSSLHIYKRDWEQVEKHFIKIVEERPTSERFV